MPRLARKYQTDKSLLFHVINRGILRQAIFHDNNDSELFLKVLKRYKKKFDFSVFHWCLMPNHYHIVMELKEPKYISKVIGACQQIYTVNYHRKYNTAGRLFQNRFKSQAIEKESYLLACGRYVELNPVRAKLVKLPWEWKFSSARFYAEGFSDGITSINHQWQASTNNADYKKWLLDAQTTPQEQKIFSSSTSIIGDNNFRLKLIMENGRPIPRGRGRPRKNC